MSREELLEEYDYELNARGLQRDDWETRGRRRLINGILAMRAEREDDLDELMILSRTELLLMARYAGIAHRHRMTKSELATILLPGY